MFDPQSSFIPWSDFKPEAWKVKLLSKIHLEVADPGTTLAFTKWETQF